MVREPPLDGLADLVEVPRILLGKVEPDCERREIGVEGRAAVGARPEDGVVVVAMAVGVLDGRLCLADAPSPASAWVSAVAPRAVRASSRRRRTSSRPVKKALRG
jgi:hypothetical protein